MESWKGGECVRGGVCIENDTCTNVHVYCKYMYIGVFMQQVLQSSNSAVVAQKTEEHQKKSKVYRRRLCT